MQKPASIVTFIVLGLAIVSAFWHWPIYWLRGVGNTKLDFSRSFESRTVRWWQWASREWNDDHQDAVLPPGQHLVVGPASEHGADASQVTAEALCFADPIGPSDHPCIDL